jgi:hypothetical protein
MSNATLLLSEYELNELISDDWVDIPDVSELYNIPVNQIMERTND